MYEHDIHFHPQHHRRHSGGRAREEYLEALWTMLLEGRASLEALKKRLGRGFRIDIWQGLIKDGLVTQDKDGLRLDFTPEGRQRAERLIRSHRLAERLIVDVLGGAYEAGACEFEHIRHEGLVDAICTLLGHPRECPHGLPIPPGECCRRAANAVKRSVIPLTQLKVGQSAVIAYVYARQDGQLHILEGLRLVPGKLIRLHQNRPVYVVEVEGAHVALDEAVAANIQVWLDSCYWEEDQNTSSQGPPWKRGFGWGRRWFKSLRRGRKPKETL